MNCYIVMLNCSFDDVVCGVYEASPAGLAQANQRANEIFANPDLRYELGNPCADTDPQSVRIYSVNNSTKLTEITRLNIGLELVDE